MGAACAFTASGPDRDITEADWLNMRLSRISFAPKDWTKIRQFIEQMCAIHKGCKTEEIQSLFSKLDKKLKTGE